MTFPRRARLDLFTPAEFAGIEGRRTERRGAIGEVAIRRRRLAHRQRCRRERERESDEAKRVREVHGGAPGAGVAIPNAARDAL